MTLDLNAIKAKQPRKTPQAVDRPLLKSLGAIASYDIKLFNDFGDKHKERFFLETALLLEAGVDLHAALQLMLDAVHRSRKISAVYSSIYETIKNGVPLAKAMESTGKFNNFDCYSVMIGESTGELAQVFSRLGAYYSKRIVQKRKITSALSYPIVVLITTAGAIYFMLKFVVPMFSETLARFGGELPGLTKFVIAVSRHVSSFFAVLTLLTAAVYLIYRRYKHKAITRKLVSTIQLKMPFWGKLVYKSHMLQFTQSMEMLLNARVNIVEGIELTSRMVKLYPLQQVLDKVRMDIMNGSFFYKSMEAQGFFDASMVMLVKIGEEVNQLDRIFARLSKRFENELDYQSGIVISILEPLMILLLAMLVAVILVAMYLPMFKIGAVIK